MSMLSRVAERLYWMARYLERAEVTARICNSYSQLILDIPKGSAISWETLITIVDAEEMFGERYQAQTEQNILKFLIADLENPASVRSSIKLVRENVRTTRDVLPEELWELVNELHLFVEEAAEQSVSRRNRFSFLEEVIFRTQQINGLIESAVCRDHAYSFLKLGRLLERADMSSRNIDTALAAAEYDETIAPPDLTLVWASLLTAVSAKSAYRREVGPLIDDNDVVEFLFKNDSFPRSILFCFHGMEDVFAELKKHTELTASLHETLELILGFDVQNSSISDKHKFVDNIQKHIIEINNAIGEHWFT